MTVNKLPESLLEETVKDRFQSMLMDFKEQGSTEEQLQEMATPEKYSKYKEISLPNAEKIVKLGLAFRDIAEKEDIEVWYSAQIVHVYIYFDTENSRNLFILNDNVLIF